jgi:hypothetical protein
MGQHFRFFLPGLLVSSFVACSGGEAPLRGTEGAGAGGSGMVAGADGEGGEPERGGRSSSGGGGGRGDGAGQSNSGAGEPNGDAGRGESPVAPDGVVKLLVEPGGILLTPDAPAQRLVATALDADGNEVDAEIAWETSNDGAITVDGNGLVRREGPAASALITARVGDLRATLFALAATPVDGALVLSDADITAGPFAEDPSAPFTEGFRYSIELGVDPPAVGTVLLTSGEKPIAGRVVAVDGASVTLEVVPIDQIFAELVVNESLPLEEISDDEIPSPASAFKIGPFQCETDVGAVALELAKKTASATGLRTLRYDVVWEDEQKKLEVRGRPGVAFELEPTLAAALEGNVTCKVILKEYPIPIPGPAKLFLGAAVVVGAGVKLGGKIPVAGVGVNLKGDVTADLAMGFSCNGDGECRTTREIEPSVAVTPSFVSPEVSVKIEPEGQAFVYAELEGGARFSTTLRTEAIQAQAGFKLAGTFATEETQVEDDAYASNYELSFEAEVGPGEAVNDFFGLLGFGLSFLKFETSERLAGSPTGAAVATVSKFAAGDDVTFNVALEPETVNLPIVGYNVEKVRVYRREQREGGGTALILANEQVAEPDQTQFSIPWVATVGGVIEGSFVAFATTSLISLPLEVGAVAPAARTGVFANPFLPELQINDGYVVALPVGNPENPGDTPLTLARVLYSGFPNGVEVCSRQRILRDAGYVSVSVAAEGDLVPGTYPYANWATGIQPGTAFVVLTRSTCETSEDDITVCSCTLTDIMADPEDMDGGFQGEGLPFKEGALVLTEVEGLLKGTFTFTPVSTTAPPTTGDFTVPVCPKTPEEHAAIRAGMLECVAPEG